MNEPTWLAPSEPARAFWTIAAGHGEIRPAHVSDGHGDDVLVRTLFTGVSRGTEALVFNGHVPPSEYERMRAPFQEGSFPFPVKYGYINVGIVAAGPHGNTERRVFTLFPHQTFFRVPESATHELPDDVPSPRAVLAANLETAITGVWDAAPKIGDHVVVLGAGTVGCLVAWLVREMAGTSCTLSDINPRRAEVARALGVDFVSPEELDDTANVVIHTSGSAAGLVRALEIAAPEATIVEMSWHGDRHVTLPLGQAFHSRRLTIKSSQVGRIPPSHREQWTMRDRMALALRLLAEPVLDVLITGESAFEEMPEVMVKLASGAGDTLCHRIRY